MVAVLRAPGDPDAELALHPAPLALLDRLHAPGSTVVVEVRRPRDRP